MARPPSISKAKTIRNRVILILFLCLFSIALPLLLVPVAFLAWTIYVDLTEKPSSFPDPVTERRWTVTSDDPVWRDYFEAHCESPAEAAFMNAMISSFDLKPDGEGRLRSQGGTVLDLQVQIGRYRADFVVNDRLVVEVDGAAYHSSPEAVANDAARDDYLRSVGYTVLRVPAKIALNAPTVALFKLTVALASAPPRTAERKGLVSSAIDLLYK